MNHDDRDQVDPAFEARLAGAFRDARVPGAPKSLRERATTPVSGGERPPRGRIERWWRRPRVGIAAALVLAVLAMTYLAREPVLHGRDDSNAPSATPTGTLFLAGQAPSGDGWRLIAGGPGLRRDVTDWTGAADIHAFSSMFTPSGIDQVDKLLQLPAGTPSVDPTREAAFIVDIFVGDGPTCGRIRFDGVAFDGPVPTVTVRYTPGELVPRASGASPDSCMFIAVPAAFVVAVDLARLPPGILSARVVREDGHGGSTTAATRDVSVGDPQSSTVPGVVAAPHWPIPGVDAGTTAMPTPGPGDQIDSSWTWGSIAWSPDGRTLAAAAQGQMSGLGQIHLFDRSGHAVGAIPGFEAAWVDDTHLMTLELNDDLTANSAWLWSTDARESTMVVSGAYSLLPGPTGIIAIHIWTTANGYDSYRVWDHGTLSDAFTGVPTAWTPDGSRLVVVHQGTPGFGPSPPSAPPTIVLAAGAPPPAWIEVLAYPGLDLVRAFRGDLIDGRGVPLIEPSGRYVAAMSASGGAAIFDIRTGHVDRVLDGDRVLGWDLSGRLVLGVLEQDHEIRTWDPRTHALGPVLGPGTRFLLVDGRVLTVPSAATDPWPTDIVSTGAFPLDWELRAWAPASTGNDWTPLYLTGQPPGGALP